MEKQDNSAASASASAYSSQIKNLSNNIKSDDKILAFKIIKNSQEILSSSASEQNKNNNKIGNKSASQSNSITSSSKDSLLSFLGLHKRFSSMQQQRQLLPQPQAIKKQQQLQQQPQSQPQSQSQSQLQPKCQRISEQQIIIKDAAQQGLIQSIICPVCLLTLPLPYYECEQCNNNFCPECLEGWWKKHFEKQSNNKDERQMKHCIFKCENGMFSIFYSPRSATFKKVKRSNTYNALFEAIQFKCKFCYNAFPLSQYAKHKNQTCEEIQIECGNDDCLQKVKRKDASQHRANQCIYRIQKCQFCKNPMTFKTLQNHQQTQCEQRTFSCKNKQQGCEVEVIFRNLQEHQAACNFNKELCKLCKLQLLRKDIVQHDSICQAKQIQCEWCQQVFSIKQFKVHQDYDQGQGCSLKKQPCKLCKKLTLVSHIEKHRNQCVFEHMIKYKQQNQAILQQNKKLHQKIHELQEHLEDMVLNRQKQTINTMNRIKQIEKEEMLMDIKRIDNSLMSISKLHASESEAHLEKIPHLISYCMKCKDIQKNFAQMKRPLIQRKKQIAEKIDQITKSQQQASMSMIRKKV